MTDRALPLLALPLLAVHALTACAAVSAPGRAPAPCPPSRAWTAFVNDMPGIRASPRLIVTGEANLAPGTRAALVPGPTDRRQPPGQRFALTVARAAGAPGGWQEVRFELTPALTQYGEVIVTCGGAEVGRIAPVETVV